MLNETMNRIEPRSPFAGAILEGHLFDEGGFLIDPEIWTEDFAAQLAVQDGLGDLGEDHWRAIHFMRDSYLRLGAILPVRNLCRSSGLTRDQLRELFGGCYGLWRIAGLPDPGQEVRNYMK